MMPELPEVEVVRRDLEKEICSDQQILQFIFHRKDIRDPIPIKKINKLVGSSILKIRRRAKYLLFETEQGNLISHLGMSGSWRICDVAEKSLRKHDHIEIHFSDGKCFIYNDPRRFGIFDFSKDLENYKKMVGLGPEPWAAEFSVPYLVEKFKKINRSIKLSLMDPKIVVGVGNIYASEILFEAGIKPQKKSCRLSQQELEKIISITQKILEQAILGGGSTIKTFQQTNGNSGKFQNQHRVYGRHGKPCYECHQFIRKAEIAGRSSFWCPRCQK